MDKIRNYLIEEINRNEMMRKKHTNICRVLNYSPYLRIVISTITGFITVFAFTSLIVISIGIKSSAIGLEIFVITAGLKSLSEEINKRNDKIVLLAKSKLNSIEGFN